MYTFSRLNMLTSRVFQDAIERVDDLGDERKRLPKRITVRGRNLGRPALIGQRVQSSSGKSVHSGFQDSIKVVLK